MKKYFLLFLLAIFAVSCSKKVEVKGKITGGSPLERIEIVDAAGIATLPLMNIGVKPDGTFAGDFEAPKNGMYLIDYAGKKNLLYLKKGQTVELNGKAESFPMEFTAVGDAKANNDFLTKTQKFMADYSMKLNLQEKFGKDEKGFLADLKKIQTDLEKNIDETAKSTKADDEVVKWKKNDLKTALLSLLPQYEMYRKQVSGNPSFKVAKELKDYEKSLQEDKDVLIKEHPLYRDYMINTMAEDFQKFAESASNGKPQESTSEMFSKYLKKRTDLSQTVKDYLLSYVMAKSDLNPAVPKETQKKILAIIESDIKDTEVKEGLKKVHFAINGVAEGEVAPAAKLVTADGKSYNIAERKGRPAVMMNYASWTPYINESTIPVLREVVKFYQDKIDFVFVNFDDTKEQFAKTSSALLKGIKGTNVWAEGGLESDFAKKYGIYGFKLAPTFTVLDKDGKVASKTYFNLGEGELVTLLDKLSGLKAPQVAPEATLQNDLLAPPPPAASNPQPEPAPATK